MNINALWLALLVLPAESVVAGWFGPSSQADCFEEFAEPAKTSRLSALAMMACREAFANDVHDILHDRNMCIAKAAAAAQSDYAVMAIRERCAQQHPPPSCRSGLAFSFTNDRCEITCPDWQLQTADGLECANKCEDGLLWLPNREGCWRPIEPQKKLEVTPSAEPVQPAPTQQRLVPASAPYVQEPDPCMDARNESYRKVSPHASIGDAANQYQAIADELEACYRRRGR